MVRVCPTPWSKQGPVHAEPDPEIRAAWARGKNQLVKTKAGGRPGSLLDRRRQIATPFRPQGPTGFDINGT